VLDNLGGTSQTGLTVESKVYNTAGTLLDDRTSSTITLASQQVATNVLTPTVPTQANTVFFVELLLRQNGVLVDRNVYWQPTTDVINWNKTVGSPQAAVRSYATLTALQTLPQATTGATAMTVNQAGPNGADRLTTITITNNSTASIVGFFLRADIRRGTAGGAELSGDNELQTSIWHGNDITLWPGESQTITATWNSADLQGATPVVSVSGWNMPKIDILG
jgi:exo-1,4-beta-D-glucosaminidase